MSLAEIIGMQQKLRASAREFFALRGYTEAETPLFVCTPDLSPNLNPAQLTLHVRGAGSISGALITSPEYALKKVVASGVSAVFEFAKVFRDHEPIDAWHSHAFTMLEFYRLNLSFKDGIRETQELCAHVARVWHGGKAMAQVAGRVISLESEHWETLTIKEVFEQAIDRPFPPNPTREWYEQALIHIQQTWDQDDTIGDLFQRVFFAVVQPLLDRADHPIIISEYPAHEASLARLNAQGYAERFEAYIGGIELCNAYGELTDGKEQHRRFVAEKEERRRLGKTDFPADEELCAALDRIHQPLFGNAIGWDRLMALITGAPSIAHTQLFPLHGLGNSDTFRLTQS